MRVKTIILQIKCKLDTNSKITFDQEWILINISEIFQSYIIQNS